ncbi:unnamed protein product [Phytophthora lilii]|uniref:Unnamed protein product n=1 Tax=Phytophthora lilii TaxID=2077276 RepID=A0A9W7CTY3_9STRA|nr:unnamed protein product [Phytophthora lilii]
MGGVRLLVLGNGAAGAEKQALALGNRLREKLLEKRVLDMSDGLRSRVECVRVTLGRSRLFPPVLQLVGARLTGNPLFGYKEQDARRLLPVQRPRGSLDVVIGCGRSTVALCAVMKQLDPARTFNVQIQHPRVPLSWFDAVVAPRHDFPEGSGAHNLFLTSGTVHDITPELLQLHGREWSDEFDEKVKGRKTRVVWLLGGPCRGFAFTEEDAERMVQEFVQALPRDDDVAVLVTFSRRTPSKVQKIIRRGLNANLPEPGQLFMWDGTERRNPYYALLATASCVVTTPDSISMTTEAIASGKPVLTVSVERCKRFHQSLFESSSTAPYTGDTVGTVLQQRWYDSDKDEKNAVRSIAYIALEKELASIVNSIATDVQEKLEGSNTS